jgi:hypothetical protein
LEIEPGQIGVKRCDEGERGEAGQHERRREIA